MSKSLAADFILYLHFIYILTVVLPIPLILVGSYLRWTWIKNPLFRKVHLSMILLVVVESFFGIICPLSVWEEVLRRGDLQAANYSQGFIATWISKIIFFSFPPWVFTLQYVLVALIVGELYIWIPPRKSRR